MLQKIVVTGGLVLVIVGGAINIYRRIRYHDHDRSLGQGIMLIGVLVAAIGMNL